MKLSNKIFSVTLLALTIWATPVLAARNISIAWEAPKFNEDNPLTGIDESKDPIDTPEELTGYYVYWGTKGRATQSYTNKVRINGRVTRASLTGLPDDQPIFIAMTSFDSLTNESKSFSQEIFLPSSSPTPEDKDGDGLSNESDNCAELANPDQADTDQDLLGDLCDPDPITPTTPPPPPPPLAVERVNGCNFGQDQVSDLAFYNAKADPRIDLLHKVVLSDGKTISAKFGNGATTVPTFSDWDGDGMTNIAVSYIEKGALTLSYLDSKLASRKQTLGGNVDLVISGCQLDQDTKADLAGYISNKRRLVYHSSSTGAVKAIKLKLPSTSVPVSVICSNVLGAQTDQLIVVAKNRIIKATKNNVNTSPYELRVFDGTGKSLMRKALKSQPVGIIPVKLSAKKPNSIALYGSNSKKIGMTVLSLSVAKSPSSDVSITEEPTIKVKSSYHQLSPARQIVVGDFIAPISIPGVKGESAAALPSPGVLAQAKDGKFFIYDFKSRIERSMGSAPKISKSASKSLTLSQCNSLSINLTTIKSASKKSSTKK